MTHAVQFGENGFGVFAEMGGIGKASEKKDRLWPERNNWLKDNNDKLVLLVVCKLFVTGNR
jgi:hypothetical protein